MSGEFGEINSQMADFLEEMEICRVIFHRKNTVEDMKSCISNLKKNIEYEAFVLNELCHFSGGFCNSLHCDELGHLCRVPYRVGEVEQKSVRAFWNCQIKKQMKWKTRIWMWKTIVQEQVDVDCVRCTTYKKRELHI